MGTLLISSSAPLFQEIFQMVPVISLAVPSTTWLVESCHSSQQELLVKQCLLAVFLVARLRPLAPLEMSH